MRKLIKDLRLPKTTFKRLIKIKNLAFNYASFRENKLKHCNLPLASIDAASDLFYFAVFGLRHGIIKIIW